MTQQAKALPSGAHNLLSNVSDLEQGRPHKIISSKTEKIREVSHFTEI